ncbi:Arc family DNA-binding protein [Methylomagnum ishizawai]|uniref:Arc family DNA-binding protein n=1 Tax=Methylomagnum ishizawai TaxID=1760988 RepID=UPI000A169899|nr:Arc family DNA-binding protein [Methylomagnum ishizawai]
MSKEDPQMRFRAPPALKKQIEDSAWKNRRSASAEIIARLEASFSKDWGDDEEVERLMKGAVLTLSPEMVEIFKRLEEEIRKNPVDLSKLPLGPPINSDTLDDE